MFQAVRLYILEDDVNYVRNLIRFFDKSDEIKVVGYATFYKAFKENLTVKNADVYLIDIELPDGNGIEATRLIKELDPHNEVLILTTFEDTDKLFEAIKAGASGYILKGIGFKRIKAAIFDVAQGGVVIEPKLAKRIWNHLSSSGIDKDTDVPELDVRELEVLKLVAKGLTNAEIGEVMNLQWRTVKTVLSRLYRKFGTSSRVELVSKALKKGLIEI